eukprot:CAMPEP_0172666698 /NCGR_PEP_ID=MMETSP1074-20121228/7967_1 /TAXON_ID=2916 /ORGANISM="Ceratium fusus, Strain PA161109" /LENGTH=279 /DNA_ID=CAMNT_0013483115 /DNA_START=935 /DNA_END=1777 /DNA_ORIENTATION=-
MQNSGCVGPGQTSSHWTWRPEASNKTTRPDMKHKGSTLSSFQAASAVSAADPAPALLHQGMGSLLCGCQTADFAHGAHTLLLLAAAPTGNLNNAPAANRQAPKLQKGSSMKPLVASVFRGDYQGRIDGTRPPSTSASCGPMLQLCFLLEETMYTSGSTEYESPTITGTTGKHCATRRKSQIQHFMSMCLKPLQQTCWRVLYAVLQLSLPRAETKKVFAAADDAAEGAHALPANVSGQQPPGGARKTKRLLPARDGLLRKASDQAMRSVSHISTTSPPCD